MDGIRENKAVGSVGITELDGAGKGTRWEIMDVITCMITECDNICLVSDGYNSHQFLHP